MKPTLTHSEAVTLLSDIVNERPDYRYHTVSGECLYRDPETFEPSCIVGHFLDRIGVAELRSEEFSTFEGVRAANVLPKFINFDNSDTVALLTIVQEYQDEGLPWGDSFNQALEDLHE